MTTITFITGANKSLGYETARRLTELGQTVILGARDPERGRAAAERLGLRFVRIDVTDEASVAAAVVNVSSGMGSQALIHDPDRVESTIAAPLYTASKAAVTMLTMQYAKALPEVRFNAADPGYTATDFNRHSGTQTVTEGTDAIVTLATEPATAGTGRYIDRFGPVPW
jgi:NAD(P)-dependent dehydrogenase (short-subunit alcohol dehydrogenase family)